MQLPCQLLKYGICRIKKEKGVWTECVRTRNFSFRCEKKEGKVESVHILLS